jgi:hypothetical protein
VHDIQRIRKRGCEIGRTGRRKDWTEEANKGKDRTGGGGLWEYQRRPKRERTGLKEVNKEVTVRRATYGEHRLNPERENRTEGSQKGRKQNEGSQKGENRTE